MQAVASKRRTADSEPLSIYTACMHHRHSLDRRISRDGERRAPVVFVAPEPGGEQAEVVSTAQAAALLGVSRQAIVQQIHRGRFTTAARSEAQWTISRAEIDWLLT